MIPDRGFCIQSSCISASSMAQPYYMYPETGRRRCLGLSPAHVFESREWQYDFSFLGHGGCAGNETRAAFLHVIERLLSEQGALRTRIMRQEHFFFGPAYTDEKRWARRPRE